MDEIKLSGVRRIRRTDAVERSLEAEALALERPRETQLRHIAPRISRRRRRTRGVGRAVGGGRWWRLERRAWRWRSRRRRSFVLSNLGSRAFLTGPFCPSDCGALVVVRELFRQTHTYGHTRQCGTNITRYYCTYMFMFLSLCDSYDIHNH
jgi:hypothetical protein